MSIVRRRLLEIPHVQLAARRSDNVSKEEGISIDESDSRELQHCSDKNTSTSGPRLHNAVLERR